MSLSSLLEGWRLDHRFMDNVAAWERLSALPARYADFPASLDPRLVTLLHKLDLSPLYVHQAQAVEAALTEENVVLVTGTASGKSLAYHLPTLQHLLKEPSSTALYLFPTKALAQDQAAALRDLLDALDLEIPIPLNIYDGDTSSAQRTRIRQAGGVLISNPDMLHVGILPNHARWVDFFRNLQIVVLDELHTYRGVFGSHMANVLRRLRRICSFYGSDPIFLCASATIANPRDLAEKLLEAPVTLVDEDGSPRGEKHIILYNPPVIDHALGIRRSYALETRSLAGRFLLAGLQTVVFARSRLTTEILLGYLRDEVAQGERTPTQVRGYRGGYLPLERREIERGLRGGEVRGVVATNALELGVDIGTLSAAVLAGYPGTIASTWQQFGRAGRRTDVSVGVLVASGSPLDQYIVRHPRYLLDCSPEHALINPDNLLILVNHLRCATYELPFEEGEAFGTFEDTEAVLTVLSETGEVHRSHHTCRWISEVYPAAEVNLRTGTNNIVVIQDLSTGEPQVVGEVDRQSAPIMVYPGAVYLHEGQQYVVDSLDWEQSIAYTRQAEVDFYTDANSIADVQVEEEYETALAGECIKALGRIQVIHQAASYRIVRRYTHETLGFGEIDLPPQQFETTAYWLSLLPELTDRLEDAGMLLRPNNYGPNWQEQRSKARLRDGYLCTRCGSPEHDSQQHDVHHLTPFREFGYLPGRNEAYLAANQLENLVTLCRRCHLSIETAQGTRSALVGLANVLHNVATLLLMCSPSDIGTVVEQRSARTKAPTLTIYDHAPGGLGLSVRLYELHDDLLSGALELVRDCACLEGCPACVGPVTEPGTNIKALVASLLEALFGASAENTGDF